jgi:hypothetical protein
MSKADDINTLFRRFGGNADTYQEIVATEQVGSARQKWPLLGQIRPQVHAEPPDAVRSVPQAVGARTRHVQAFPVPPVDARAHAAAAAPARSMLPSVPVPEASAALHEVSVSPGADVGVPPVSHSPAPSVERPAPVPQPNDRPRLGGVEAASGPVGGNETDLQRLFRRLLVAAAESAPAAQPAHPLKRLVKW